MTHTQILNILVWNLKLDTFSVTHLVAHTNDDNLCARTMKYLKCLITGKWIVNFECKLPQTTNLPILNAFSSVRSIHDVAMLTCFQNSQINRTGTLGLFRNTASLNLKD